MYGKQRNQKPLTRRFKRIIRKYNASDSGNQRKLDELLLESSCVCYRKNVRYLSKKVRIYLVISWLGTRSLMLLWSVVRAR